MESTDLNALRRRARTGYELGRLRAGVTNMLWALPVIAFSALTSGTSGAVAIGLVLAASLIGLRWLGQAYSRAILPGLLAGSAALVLPLLFRSTGHTCFGGVCWSLCMVGCVAGGLAAGASIGWVSARERDQRWAFLSAATLLTGLTGSLGCGVVGAAGTFGMLLAVIASSLPVALAVPVRSG